MRTFEDLDLAYRYGIALLTLGIQEKCFKMEDLNLLG